MTLVLVLGGTRSGKSARAEALARTTGAPLRYVATADGDDPGMAARVRAHVARRGDDWTTVVAGDRLDDVLGDDPRACVLIDGLGAWIAGRMHAAGALDDEDRADDVTPDLLVQVARLASLATARPGATIVVAEEAGLGVLPAGAASRRWLDVHGEATQRLAREAQRVELVVAGRSVVVGGAGDALGVDDGRDLRRHGDADVRPGDADHAVNVLAGGPPPWLADALRDALATVDRYPDERDAVAAIAALHGRALPEVVPTNGAAEALWLLAPALRPSLAACVHPAFTEAEAGLRAHGVAVARVLRDPDQAFALDPATVPDEADLVVVGNPASPSGTLDPASALLALRRPGRTVVVDEAFMDLVPGQPGSLAGEPLPGVIVVRSLTKVLSIPGVRAGYALAPAPLADALRAVRPPWSVNALALAALAVAAGRPHELAAAAELAAAERDDLATRLREIDGVRSWPAAANFCLIEVADGPGVVEALREQAIAVRPAASFPGLGPGHVRLTARSPEQNARLVEALRAAVAAAHGPRAGSAAP